MTAVAAQDCMLWQISCEGFAAVITRYPAFALGLLPVLAARNRFMIAQYEDLSFRPVRARLAKLLLDLSANGTKDVERRQHTISALAARISTVPEAISHTLREFRDGG